jgi:glutathionyl-hydroquinone reductase
MNKNYWRIMNKKLQEIYEQKSRVGFGRYQLYIARHCALSSLSLIFREV